MGLKSLVRILLGLTFIAIGFIHSRRFGKEFLPELHKNATSEFRKGWKHMPFREHVKMPPQQIQEIVAYTDLICGLLLLTGQLVNLAAPVLVLFMVVTTYIAHEMDYPIQHQAIPAVLCLSLLSVIVVGRDKEKVE